MVNAPVLHDVSNEPTLVPEFKLDYYKDMSSILADQ